MDFSRDNIKKLFGIVFGIVLIYLCTKNIYVILKAVGHFMKFISPFLLGAVLAFIINVPMRFIEGNIRNLEKKFNCRIQKKRLISFLLTLLIVIGIISVICFLVIPELTSTVKMLWNNMPEYADNIKKWLVALDDKFPVLKGAVSSVEDVEIDWEEIGGWMLSLQGEHVGSMVSDTFGIITNVVTSIVNFLIALVFACYILFQKEHLSEWGKKILYASLSEKHVEGFLNLGKLIDDTYSRFIIGQCTEALILGTLFIVSMLIFRMPFAFLVGSLVAVTALIPIVGSTIACVVGAILMLTVSPMKMIFFIILFLVIQQIEGHFIYPNVVGSSIGLPALWVLLALTVGAKLMGIGGMLIGIPTMSVIYVLLDQWIHSNLERRGVPDDKWKNENRSDAERKKEEKIRQRFQVVIKLPEKIKGMAEEVTKSVSREESDKPGRENKKDKIKNRKSGGNSIE